MSKTALKSANSADAVTEVDFYIAATGPASRPRCTLKHGNTFAVIDAHGDIGASAGGPDGIFHSDTRFLSRFELSLDGTQLLLLGSNVRDDNSVLTVDLTNPDIFVRDRLVLPKDTLHIVRTFFLWDGTVYQRIHLRNHGDQPLDLRISMSFGSDFADLFEVRGLRRKRRGAASSRLLSHSDVVLDYTGLDRKPRRAALTFDPQPTNLTSAVASYKLHLDKAERQSIFVAVRCDPESEQPPAPFFSAMMAATRAKRKAASGSTSIETSNALFNRVLCRSMADLRMLATDTAEGTYPYAGIPWYSTTFGRDGLITAIQMLWCEPAMARGVLRRLAAYQATAKDPVSDAEPGKILHEMRSGEMAALHEVPFGLYYGSIDSTPLFVLLAGLYMERTGDEEAIAELWPHIEAGLDWMDKFGDRDGDGFLEYHRETEQGLANQGWKDSHDAVFHADGSLAEGPIALVEVQAYAFAAKRRAARMARRLGHVERGEQLDRQASELAERFNAAFWCPEIGTYALALDGAKLPCRVRTSNAGQVLFSGIAPRERALEVATGLMRPAFFSGWGIRTVSRTESRYNPMSYHNGSIWPHDNALIALGFARYGLQAPIERVFRGMFETAT